MEENVTEISEFKKNEPTYVVDQQKPEQPYYHRMISSILIAGSTSDKVISNFCKLINWEHIFPDLILAANDETPLNENAALLTGFIYKTKHRSDNKFAVYEVIHKYKEEDGSYKLCVAQTEAGPFFSEMRFSCLIKDTPNGVLFEQTTDYTLPSDGYYGIGNLPTFFAGIDPHQLLVKVVIKSHAKLQRFMHNPDSFALDKMFRNAIETLDNKHFKLPHTFTGLTVESLYGSLNNILEDSKLTKTLFPKFVRHELNEDADDPQKAKKIFIMFPYMSGDTEIGFNIEKRENDSILLRSTYDSKYKIIMEFRCINIDEDASDCHLVLQYDFGGWGIWNKISDQIPVIDDAVKGFMITTMRKLFELSKTSPASSEQAKQSRRNKQQQQRPSTPNLGWKRASSNNNFSK